MELFKEIKDRKIKKWLAIYISSAITIIGLVNLFSSRYNFPQYIFDILVIIVLFGFISVFFISWFHGKEGSQEIKKVEYIIHSVIIICIILFSYFISKKSKINLLPINAKTIAVLPFTNMSDSKEDEYFSDGITEDILTQLSKISELQVISRTSIMKFKNSKLTIPEIADELGAGSILEGSVRKFNDKVRITAQLINASNDEHLWAETFDRKIDDIFELQAEIAKRIAKELEAKLIPKEELLIELKPTNNIEAYALVLKGRELVEKLTDEDNEKGIEFYKKALNIDSNYSLAYACLASAYDQKVRRYFYSPDWQDSAIAMSNKSLELNPNLSEGHSSLAKSYEAQGDFKLAKYHYEESIRLNPSAAGSIYNLGVLYYNNGLLDQAYKLVKQSIILKPNDIFGYLVLGGIYRKFDCTKLALKWFQNAFKIEPESRMVLLYLIENFLLENDLENADKYFKKLISLYPNYIHTQFLGGKLELIKKNYIQSKKYFEQTFKLSNSQFEYQYGYVLIKLNQQKEGNENIKKDLTLYLEDEKTNPNKPNINAKILADMYAILGENTNSINWLKEAVERGWTEYKDFLIYPYMENIKSSQEFNKLIDRIKVKVDSMKTIAMELDPEFEPCK